MIDERRVLLEVTEGKHYITERGAVTAKVEISHIPEMRRDIMLRCCSMIGGGTRYYTPDGHPMYDDGIPVVNPDMIISECVKIQEGKRYVTVSGIVTGPARAPRGRALYMKDTQVSFVMNVGSWHVFYSDLGIHLSFMKQGRNSLESARTCHHISHEHVENRRAIRCLK